MFPTEKDFILQNHLPTITVCMYNFCLTKNINTLPLYLVSKTHHTSIIFSFASLKIFVFFPQPLSQFQLPCFNNSNSNSNSQFQPQLRDFSQTLLIELKAIYLISLHMSRCFGGKCFLRRTYFLPQSHFCT